MVFSIFHLLAGARTQVLLLTVPYLVVVVVYSVISALLLAQINPEPQVQQYLQITYWLSGLTRLLLAVLMAIGLWRFLLLREKPRWSGLQTRPGVVWFCFWRSAIGGLVLWFVSLAIGYVTFGLWATFQSGKLDQIPFEVFVAIGVFLKYFIVLNLALYLWLGLVAGAVEHEKLSVFQSWRIGVLFGKEIFVGSGFLSVIAALTQLGVLQVSLQLLRLKNDGASAVLLNAGTSIFVMLVPLIVFWGTVAMMAMIYAREIRAPGSSAEVKAD